VDSPGIGPNYTAIPELLLRAPNMARNASSCAYRGRGAPSGFSGTQRGMRMNKRAGASMLRPMKWLIIRSVLVAAEEPLKQPVYLALRF
jgi:hypothetical protein